jgi:hypothetical protein
MTELAEIFRDAGPAYVQRFGDRLLPSHRRVLRDVVACRTPALGGQMFFCHRCDIEHSVYFSCRNRHCPKCQAGDAERWLERQRGILLPCEYGFATCTLPAELREIAHSHQRVVYSILIREAAHALLEMAGNRLFIGGLTGIMAVLQTWTGVQIYHPHVHMLFPVGGLGENGDSWVKPKKRTYILPGYGLAKVFRKRVEVAFRKAGLYDLVPRKVWHRRWVANVKRVGSGENALLYLSRYVFRIAISNERILAFDGQRVTFSAKTQDGMTVRHTVGAHEFIRRFLQHVLPKHFVKIRYYGIWAPTCRDKLAVARKILEHHLTAIGKPPRPPKTDRCAVHDTRPRCPYCGTVYRDPPCDIPRSRAPP